MTTPGRQHGGEPPIGRRMARLRARRGLSQAALASRIGRSKSWVEKVERGLRSLDRLSMIEAVAQALGVAPEVLFAGDSRRREPIAGVAEAVERIRAALARYDTVGSDADGCSVPPSVQELDRRVGHAWEAYRYAHHPQVLRMLPDLLGDIRQLTAEVGPVDTADLSVRGYRLAAQVLVKLGAVDLAWLAADRAMARAAGDARRTAMAAIPLTQVLRALGRGRLAMTAAAVPGIDPDRDASPEDLAAAGILLTEAARAAATCGEATAVRELTGRAARLADRHDGQPYPDRADLGFAPIMVDLARALAAADLGDSQQAVAIHLSVIGGDAWRLLSAEHRAAHLIDISRAYLDLGDLPAAGRALVTADQIAPAETRTRPAAHTALTAVLHAGPTSADLTRLAAVVGLTR